MFKLMIKIFNLSVPSRKNPPDSPFPREALRHLLPEERLHLILNFAKKAIFANSEKASATPVKMVDQFRSV